MTRIEYINYLSHKLRRLPKEDFDRAMNYYEEYFDEAGPDNEQQAIEDLGSPDDAADQIILEAALNRTEGPRQGIKKRISTVWVVILAIFAAPVAFPLAISAAAIIFSLFLVILCLALAGFCVVVGSATALIGGIVLLFEQPLNGLATIGTALISIGLGILMIYGFTKLFQWCVDRLSKRFAKSIKRRKKDEIK